MSDDMSGAESLTARWLLIDLGICIGSGILVIWAFVQLVEWIF